MADPPPAHVIIKKRGRGRPRNAMYLQSWCHTTRVLMRKLGLEPEWIAGTPEVVGLRAAWASKVQQAVTALFEAQWRTKMKESRLLDRWYVGLKTDFKLEDYLLDTEDPYARGLMVRLRTGVHTLRIHTGRFEKEEVTERLCFDVWWIRRRPRDGGR